MQLREEVRGLRSLTQHARDSNQHMVSDARSVEMALRSLLTRLQEQGSSLNSHRS